MRLFAVFAGDNEISVHNNYWNGVETVRYNGEKVSSKFSWFGATHHFTVEEDGELVDYEVEVGFTLNGVSANVWRNNSPIMIGIKRGSTC
jgi:hypothetical protein